MCLFFHPYYTNKPQENGNHEFWMGLPFFHKNCGLKPQKFQVSLVTTKASVEIYITKLTPLENGSNEIWMGHPLFAQKIGVKPQKIEFSHRAIKTNVEWVCYSMYPDEDKSKISERFATGLDRYFPFVYKCDK